MSREIIFDTETTGFDPGEHRIIEIGAVEMVNRIATGRTYHVYLNPEREIDWQAQRVHGISNERVAGEPKFAEIMHDMLAFFGDDAMLVAHNVAFDKSFINMELTRAGLEALPEHRYSCSLELAKKRLPGQRHSLDSLCRHYEIDNSNRTFHGALLDAQLLALVYVELHGGLQGALTLESSAAKIVSASSSVNTVAACPTIVPATADEQNAHATFLAKAVSGGNWPVN